MPSEPSVRRHPWRLVRHDGWSRWERTCYCRDGLGTRHVLYGPTMPEHPWTRPGDS